MRALKILNIVMAMMIVAGLIIGGVTIYRRQTAPASASAFAAEILLDEPAGTRIVSMAGLPDRLAIQLQGGGMDRIVFLDPRSGQILGRAALAR